ncbi:transposable element Tcb2 transposase [Trichonephila clavipes]|nr:transposable element Tcb2 transposase [Trichonephila clavipes]
MDESCFNATSHSRRQLDSTRPHKSADIQQLLKRKDIPRMDWPVIYHDLNLIEHVWDALGRHLVAQLHPPKNIQQLKQMLSDEWALIQKKLLE